MKSIINKLYQAKDGEALSHHECQEINTELAMLKSEDIPLDKRENVADYLASSFNHHSVQSQVASKLESLLQELQENA